MRIRTYEPGDRAHCVELLRANTPEYFGPRDEDDFVRFLEAPQGRYFVIEDEGGLILGAGGIAGDENVAVLCWGMVHPDWQRMGIGSALLQHRVDVRRASQPELRLVRVDTSQRAQGFFEAHGFIATRVEPDGYAPGLDRVSMERPVLRESRPAPT